jgi:hypothetical protein
MPTGKFRPQIFLAILSLSLLAGYAVFHGIPEVATATIGGVIALGMKVLEGE